MEPFTIVVGVTGLCSTVISASSRLYTFINASKNVHRSVKDLKAEVDTLGKAISSIKPVLESQISSTNQDNAQSEEDKELWLSVQSTISECRATLDRLQESLVNAPSKEVDMGTQAIRTIKFNMRSEEINSTRVQVRSHTSALQLILQMIDLRATYLTPSLIINELGPKIDGLRALLEPDEENHVIPTSAVHPHHPERLHRTALRVLSSATTVSEASVYSPSIMGERMDEETRRQTFNWIPDADTEEPARLSGEQSTPTPSEHSDLQPTVGASASSATQARDITLTRSLDLKLFWHEVNTGKSQWYDCLWQKAQLFLERALQQGQKLVLANCTSAPTSELDDIEVMLATCEMCTRHPEEAKLRLTKITQKPPTYFCGVKEPRCLALLLLAELLFQEEDFEAAQSSCQSAVSRSRPTAPSEDAHVYHASLLLGAAIFRKLCEPENADIYYQTIPQSRRGSVSRDRKWLLHQMGKGGICFQRLMSTTALPASWSSAVEGGYHRRFDHMLRMSR